MFNIEMNFLRITDITMHNGLLMITATDTDFATITKTFSLTELHAIQQKKRENVGIISDSKALNLRLGDFIITDFNYNLIGIGLAKEDSTKH